MINLELTPKIKEWLDTPEDRRDYAKGALLLGKVSRNKILFRNVSRNPKGKASTITYHLQKIYSQRMADITHEQVAAMMTQCDAISKAHGLDNEPSKKSDFQKGKRPDHDSLPDEIKRLWQDQADIRRKMRDCHTKLRLINPSNSTCPDNDRYPFAKELIRLDIIYRDNWNRYDHYVAGQQVSEVVLAEDPRTASKNAAKTANMLLGKYAKSPDDKTASRIKEAYAKIISPTPALTDKMRLAQLL